MRYEDLKDFLEHKMRMSQIYQPLMLITLLKHGGTCTQAEIARAILEYDESQIEYYESITNNMVGRVLRSHKIVQKDKKNYNLIDFDTLTEEERDELLVLCEQKLDKFIDKRGSKIWTHRRKSAGYISGTVRYEILKRAKFHCELCGVSADVRALEVDHIRPRNQGGVDDLYNLQALCYRCNAMKRDRDSTDFREVNESFYTKQEGCLFCNIDRQRIINENPLAYAIRDGFPVTVLHSLVIPKRHVVSFFELGQSEINACLRMVTEVKQEIESKDPTVKGFNVGINDGEAAGQSVFHCHIQVIPRRHGDIDNPKGGIRHVIPDKGYY
ncbi:HIT domain-containing protein [Chloroflexota bacterium]